MILKPGFPSALHKETAEIVRDYFLAIPDIDTVLLVNSCARGKAVPESDLDFAILIKPGIKPDRINNIEQAWQTYSISQETILKYKETGKFAHLHLDIIEGNYTPSIREIGTGPDHFEIEVGNQICYSSPMGKPGDFFLQLQEKWLPYYADDLQAERFISSRQACEYDLDHIPFFIRRELYFQAFDILWKAFQEYLQTLFIANKIYPIAYNKWIKEQIVELLNKPDLYPELSPILSITNIESTEINAKAKMLSGLLDAI